MSPEHLQLRIADAESQLRHFQSAAAICLGERSAETFGDYGFGPNHTLPTGGTARAFSGLSVLNVLRLPPIVSLTTDALAHPIADDVKMLVEWEGLAAHARSIDARRRG